MRESNPELHRKRVSKSLTGKFGELSRRWKGEEAGYVAKHIWLSNNYEKPSACEKCGTEKFSRLEWANKSGKYLRNRKDYLALCPSCHRRMDFGNTCKKGHEFTKDNTYIRKEGWRVCRKCSKEAKKRYAKNYKV